MTTEVPLPAESTGERARVVAAGVASSADVVSLGAAPSSLAALWQAMRKDRFALAGLIIYAFFLLLAVIGPWIAPHDPLAVMKEGGKWLSNEPPFARFALGTTNMGRDIFSAADMGRKAGHHCRLLGGLYGRRHRHHRRPAIRLFWRLGRTRS